MSLLLLDAQRIGGCTSSIEPMQTFLSLFIGLLLLVGSASSFAQDAEWKTLNDQVKSLYDKGQYERAVVAAKKALEVAETLTGPEHPDVAESLNDLARAYQAQGRYADAEPLYQRSLAIREKALGPEHPDVAESLNNLAEVYRVQGRYADAEPFYQRSLAIMEKALGPEHPRVAASLKGLANLYVEQGRYADAEPLYQRSLVINEKVLGPEHPDTAASLDNLAVFYDKQGRYAEAELLYQRSLAINEKARGREHPDTAKSLNNLAILYYEQGRYAEAESLHQRSLAIREKVLGPEHPDTAASLDNLAILYDEQGRYATAEPLYKRSLAIKEKALGPEHRDVADSLNNLAGLYVEQGRYADAEPLHQRSLAIREKAFGPEHRDVSDSLNNLAELYVEQGRYADAEPLHQRSLAIRTKALGPEHPDVGESLNNLATLYNKQGRYAEAELLYQRSLAIWEKVLGPEHRDVADSLDGLGGVYQTQGRYADAEPLYQRSLAIYEKALGPEHPLVAAGLDHFARLYGAQGRYADALAPSHRGYQILRQRFALGAGEDVGQLAEQKSNRDRFTSHIRLLSDLGDPALGGEAFAAAQLAQASSVGQSVAQMATRFASRSDALAQLIRARQDTVNRLARAEKNLLQAISQPPDKRDLNREAVERQSVADLAKLLAEQTKTIATRFPQYDALVSAAPIAAEEVKQLLRPREALVVYLVSDNGCFAWVVTRAGLVFRRINIAPKELNAQVARLRERLDPQLNPTLAAFDVAAAHQLYQSIFASLEPALVGVKHVILVPDGALQSLPFAVLVARIAAKSARTSWLADRYAFSVVPSVAALRALRTFSRSKPGKEPFIGFGNPLLEGEVGGQRRLAARALFDTDTSSVQQVSASGTIGIANVEAIRRFPPLPETAEELRAAAAILHAAATSYFQGAQATETRVKQTALAQYRVVSFATHGAIAGEMSGVAEPGLILTPPAKGTELDDGYLTASEAAQLKLNADWVLLSACNTAAPDGTPGAEGLSGLAKGFFYAGARSLLVSNWAVASQPTVALTTGMLRRYAADPALGKAEALRQAMLQLRANPKYAHPLFWAPFVVVGEGGTSQK